MAAVDALVSKVVDMLTSTYDQEFGLSLGAMREVQWLISNLQAIQTVLVDAERRQQTDATVQLWLDRLKSVAYDIDDVLDEWSYEILKSRIVPTKVWSFILLSVCFCFPQGALRYRVSVQLNDLCVRLDVIANEKDKYGFLFLRGNDEQVERSATTSITEVEKERLVNLFVWSSESWKFEEAECSNWAPLWLSYYDLPLSLKPCFLYCVVFPKGYRMSKDELISLWMAHGFLKPTNFKDVEMVGDDYFYNLAMRSIFQDTEVKEKFDMLDKTYCKMHDIVHGFAKFVMEKECLYIDVNSSEEVTSSVVAEYSDNLYHLHVKLGEKVEFPKSFYNLRKLRSLFVLPSNNDSMIGAALPKIFNRLTCLRSLSLSRCGLEKIASNINKLIHLKWLKLSKNYALKELPETICELYNLQTLSVNWCDGLIHFPKGIEKLTNLRYLKNDYTYFLLPNGIGKLNGLEKLLRITIDPKFKDAFSLRGLKNLNNICGSLTIFFVERERDKLVEDAKQAQLKGKKHVTALSLNFPERATEEWMQQQDEELVEALKPPPSLKMLRITHYMGANPPSWINTLTSLKKLKLWYWNSCKHLPALAMLPCLEHIEFNNFGRVKEVTAEFYRMERVLEASSSTAPLFPKLTNLRFMNMNEWEEWSDYDGDEQVMPCLSYLSIENCPKLKAFPNFIHKKAALCTKIS